MIISQFALYVNNNARVKVNGALEARANESNSGIIYLNNSTLTIASPANFHENKAKDNGGAIYAHNSGINIESKDVVFSTNSAVNNGGAIYLDSSTLTQKEDCEAKFIGNEATNGGAIYMNSAEIDNDTNIYFIRNKANKGAALYYAGNPASGILDNLQFEDSLNQCQHFFLLLYF